MIKKIKIIKNLIMSTKKPGLKNKEINPLLKDLNIEKMNSAQIEEEIKKETNLMNNFISHYKYPDAEICDKKIVALKKILKQKKTKEINQRHTAEKEHLKIDEFSDINNLKFLWDKKFEELEARSQAALDELKKNQDLEYQQLLSRKEEGIKLQPSAALLRLQKEEEGLVKLRKFKEAEVVRKKKEAQIKNDMNKLGKNKETSLKMLEKKLRQKHTNELLYLQNKFQAEFDELNKEKMKQVEFLNKKYSVKNKDLINQQKRESNINKYKNYGRRIEKLSNNYGEKFLVGRAEYAPPKNQEEKTEQIYAELQDNKIERVNLEQNMDSDINEKNNDKNNGEIGNEVMGEDSGDFNRQQEILQNEIDKNEENEN